MKKRFALMTVLLLLIFGGAIGFKLFKQAMIRDYLANMETPAVPLRAAVVAPAQWDVRLAAIGSLTARRGIDIRSEASGVISKVHVESGEQVKEGQLLLSLDDSVERATLKSAKVRMEKTRRNFKRDQALFERDLISDDEFENSRSEYESAEALAEETQGIIDRKTIRAPFAGTVGIHSLTEGHYLAQGDEALSLQALDTLYLDMLLPEKELERVRVGQRVVFTVPSRGEQTFHGEIRFVDARVEASTRNIQVRALVDNAERALLPGMFANAYIVVASDRPVLTVPMEAVAYSLYGETVYRLRPPQAEDEPWTASRQRVTTGAVRDVLVAIQGIEAGEWVARDTQNRLLEGTPVKIVNRESLPDRASVAESR